MRILNQGGGKKLSLPEINAKINELLKSHRYPPEGMDDAVATVMQQCELWADNVMSV